MGRINYYVYFVVTRADLLVTVCLLFSSVYTNLLFLYLLNDSFCSFFALSSFSGERFSTRPGLRRPRSSRLYLTNTARQVGAQCKERVGHPWKWTASYCFCLTAPRFVWSDEAELIVHSGEAWGNGCRSVLTYEGNCSQNAGTQRCFLSDESASVGGREAAVITSSRQVFSVRVWATGSTVVGS